MFIASPTTTSSFATTAASRRRSQSFWNTPTVQPTNSTSWNDILMAKQEITTTKSLTSNTSKETPMPDSSHQATTPEQIQSQLKAWIEHGERLNIIV
jgi:hypothetical protein